METVTFGDPSRYWITHWITLVDIPVLRSKDTMIVTRFSKDQPLNTRRYHGHAQFNITPSCLCLLTYIFNFPIDTLNKNFMKMVGGCATKERVLLNQLHSLPLPLSSCLFSLVSCFNAQTCKRDF